MMMAPLSAAYAGVLAVRSAWWERFGQPSPLPAVSVGNLTIGGNGKTPFTLFLATRLRQRGIRTAIVSRGYGGQLSRGPKLVSTGPQITMTPRQAGDEPVMMAKSFEGPVAVARRRIDAIKLLAANGLADAVVLDDAFQHVRLRRDCDLLVINQSVGLGNGWLLPAGPLRENWTALQRADALVLIQSLSADRSIPCPLEDIARGKPILAARLQPLSLTYSENGNWREAPLMLEGRRVAAVSGIVRAGLCEPKGTGEHTKSDLQGELGHFLPAGRQGGSLHIRASQKSTLWFASQTAISSSASQTSPSGIPGKRSIPRMQPSIFKIRCSSHFGRVGASQTAGMLLGLVLLHILLLCGPLPSLITAAKRYCNF
jgi:tetraacyldisaccharide 4'-kinase